MWESRFFPFLSAAALRRAGPHLAEVVQELFLPFPGCNTQENELCSFIGQRGLAGTGGKDAGEADPRA